ncbi:MAG: hypothetical protein AB1Z19_06835 [Eubacteriales bacterium]
MTCWFCEKNEADASQSIRLVFERYNYADKIAQSKGEQPDRLRKTLTIGRCNSCSQRHKTYKRISLWAIAPASVLAFSLFLLFRHADPNLVFVVMAIALLGFGAVLVARMKYLKSRGVKAMVELEMKNEDIKQALASGWYRA